MAMLFQLQRLRPAVLDGVAQPVQGAHPGIAAPRENELARAAHADELIVDQVGRHADQREVATALADDLVAGSKGIRCVNPSMATVSPSCTYSAIASASARKRGTGYRVKKTVSPSPCRTTSYR